MKVLELVEKQNLQLVDKIYKSVYGEVHLAQNVPNLKDLEVKCFTYWLTTNEAVITVLDIEKYDITRKGNKND